MDKTVSISRIADIYQFECLIIFSDLFCSLTSFYFCFLYLRSLLLFCFCYPRFNLVHYSSKKARFLLCYAVCFLGCGSGAYAEVSRYIEYYNRKRRHGSLGYMAPEEFHRAFMCKLMKVESFVA
ncbi:MAG: IS3 family transposase [Moorellaceae bacterium]